MGAPGSEGKQNPYSLCKGHKLCAYGIVSWKCYFKNDHSFFKNIDLHEQKNGGSLLLKRVEINVSSCRHGGFGANDKLSHKLLQVAFKPPLD